MLARLYLASVPLLAAAGCMALLDVDRPNEAAGLVGAAGASGAAGFASSVFTDDRPVTLVDDETYLTTKSGSGAMTLSRAGESAPLLLSQDDYPGVLRVAEHVRQDIGRVTGSVPDISTDAIPQARQIVIAGTVGKSSIVDRLVREAKLDVSPLENRWEKYLLVVVEKPLPGVNRAVVIAGSDKRGTIYGLYDLSAQIGVSAWAWWADVPVAEQTELYIRPGRFSRGEPAVKYRGIFINDESPALYRWALTKMGGLRSKFYDKVFELMSRLKANLLWPAMWSSVFNEDDPKNPELADEYGIVMGTSHHEPMMRAGEEWSRQDLGDWNYETHADAMKEFWRGGIERMGSRESIVTLGARGDGDKPLSGDPDVTDIPLLTQIIADQRTLLDEVTGQGRATIPQVWSLYKEVQNYYDQGMRVPEDVTLLLSDDNFGNIRRLPKPDESWPGGFGMYYHYDFVGGPRNYKWINTNCLARVWEQMDLTYRHGVDRIWIVNVGDIKPMEFPTEFFMDLAWAPERFSADNLGDYAERWAKKQFGARDAATIGKLLIKYAQYNARRKPELLAPSTYSLINFHEAEGIVADCNALAEQAQELYDALPEEYQDAFFELVSYPVQASANLNDLYVTAAQNRLYFEQGRARTNDLAERVRALFDRDAELSRYYNETLAGGKWQHMMDQTHIGYETWQEPDTNTMPEVSELDIPGVAEMGVAVEGSRNYWPSATETAEAALPDFCVGGSEPAHSIDVFNRGSAPFDFSAESDASWLSIDPASGRVDQEQRLWLSVDWAKAPEGTQDVPITLRGPNGTSVVVHATVRNPDLSQSGEGTVFVECNGAASMEAEHYTRAVTSDSVDWQVIPDFGRTLSGVMPIPVTSPRQTPGADSPRLEYRMLLSSQGKVRVRAHVAPTQSFYQGANGFFYAISFDDQPPQRVNIDHDTSKAVWETRVSANINLSTTEHTLEKPGWHVLKFWMVDAGVVLEKLVVETATAKSSYLGPTESRVAR